MKKLVILVIVCGLTLIGIVQIAGGIAGLPALIYLPPILYFTLGTVVLVLLSGSSHELYRGLFIAFSSNSIKEEDDLDTISESYILIIKGTVLVILIGVVISSVSLLGNLNPNTIGPSVATGLLTILYGSILIILLFSIKHRVHMCYFRWTQKQ